jgi:hypothetical protein
MYWRGIELEEDVLEGRHQRQLSTVERSEWSLAAKTTVPVKAKIFTNLDYYRGF